jgi:FtsP/CotA-like multicopper oxidase with cupredoxin domain
VVLSDWIDENPQTVLVNLKKDGDYYALKKGSVQSWDKVIANGMPAIKNRFINSWKRMGPMDLSDVGYDAFLANGQIKTIFSKATKGDKIRVRIVNAAASSYFYVEFAGGDMRIIAADGVNVQPFNTKRLRIAVAETYDIIIRLPKNKAYELRATSEDGTGFSSVIIGSGELVKSYELAKPNLFMYSHGTQSMYTASTQVVQQHHMTHNSMSAMAQHNMPPIVSEDMHKTQSAAITPRSSMAAMMHMPATSEYKQLKALQPTTLPANNPRREVVLELTGNMEDYVWSFNNETLTEADVIPIKKGENVKFVFINKTMMHHPLHLHGHFFRVLNGQGAYSPLKHTVNVPPMARVAIEFYANQEKDWFFHCHNLYHVKAGMARVIHYESSITDPKLVKAKLLNPFADDTQWFGKEELRLYSNKISGLISPMNTRNFIQLDFDADYDGQYDTEVILGRRFSKFFAVYIGANANKFDDIDTATQGMYGLRYILPLLIEAEVEADENGEIQLELSSSLQLTDRLVFNWQIDTDDEYQVELHYEVNKQFLLSINHDSKFSNGAGVSYRF